MTLHHAIFHGTIRVRHGQHVEFRRWLGRYDAALAHFPGKLGNVTVPPPAGSNTWSMRLVFETSEQLEAWLDSSERADLLREAAPLLEGGPIYKITRDHPSDGSVTEVLFAKIQPGAENAFRHWSTKINRAQSRYPGYLGVTIQPPFAGQYEWTTLLRFDSPENLDNWLKSPDRRELMREMQTFLVSGSRHRLATSFPSWIPAPPASARPAPNWKTTALVLLGLFPIVMLEMWALGGILNQYFARSPGMFVANMISAGLTGYVSMPLLVRAFRWWLFLREDSSKWITPVGIVLLLALYAAEIILFWNLH